MLQDGAFGNFDFEQIGPQVVTLQAFFDRGLQCLVGQLPAGEVDAHAQLGPALLMPRGQLPAGLLQHPLADGHDQSGFFE